MKSQFIGFYKEILVDTVQLLQKATIVIDTNVLLDVYRYSKATASQILQMMDSFKEQLWMPYQVAFEYHKDRNNKVLGGHVRTYSKLIKSIDDWKKTFDEERKHPFLEEADIKALKQNLENIRSILCKGRENCSQLIREDEYKRRIADLYEGKLGEDYSSDDKISLIKEAKIRYEKQIPPGYKDSNKDDNECGDYLIWRQMIDFAKEKQCPIIFVSNDVKEDWIEDVAGIKLGPRPELIDEFYKETKQLFYCYDLDQFIKLSNSQVVTKEAKEEIENRLKEQQSQNDPIVGDATPTSSPIEVYVGDTSDDRSCSEV